MTALALPSGTSALVPASMDAWIDAALAQPAAVDQLRINALAHAEAVRGRHAPPTRAQYDWWWSRFDRWCRDPASRVRGRALPAATPELALDPDDPRGLRILWLWLAELVHGPEGDAAQAEWAAEFGSVAPSTLAQARSAITARCQDHLGHPLATDGEFRDAYRGLRRQAREAYGRDRQATPIVGELLRVMLTYLAGATDPLVARDRVLVELAGCGVTAAETARLTIDGLLDPDPALVATTHESNETLWRATGRVGARSLVVPGRSLGAGRHAPARLITLLAGHPLTVAVDAWLPHRLGDPSDRALIDGVGTSNPRSIHRQALRALAADAAADGCTWTPARGSRPSETDLTACRRALARRASADLALRQRDTAALWIGWRVALRRSELIALDVADLELHPDRALVHIRRSKTDQEGRGVTLPIAAGSGAAALDPLGDLRAWLDTLARLHGYDDRCDLPADTPLFPALCRGQQILTRHVELADGTIELRRYDRMSDQAWSDRVRAIAERSGAVTDPRALARVSGHSLRRGYVTSAARAGRSPIDIRRITRHADLNCLMRYVEQVQLQWGDLDDSALLADAATASVGGRRTTLDERLGVTVART